MNDMNVLSPEVEAICPKCGCTDVVFCHHYGSFAVPECDYKRCELCEHQWDHS